MKEISGFFPLFNGVGTHIDRASRFLTLLKSVVPFNNPFLTAFFRSPKNSHHLYNLPHY